MSDDGAGNGPGGNSGSGPKPPYPTKGEVATYTFPVTGETVRSTVRDGLPWFVAADVATALGYGGGARNAVGRLPERMKGVASVNTPGGEQAMTVLSEAGVFRLVMRSNIPAAEAFQDWLAEDVIPAIMHTGSYVAPHALPQSFAEALELAARQAREIETATARVAELEPAAAAWDVLASASGDYSVREAAFILNRDPAISTGQRRLFTALREFGLLDRRNVPYASHSRHVTLRAGSYEHPKTGDEVATQQVRVTADGLRYLHRRLGGTGALDLDTPLPLRGVA